MYVILGIIVAVVGIIMLVNPRGVYEVTQSWKTNGGEPSDAYLLHTRISGAVFLLVGVVCTALLLLLP